MKKIILTLIIVNLSIAFCFDFFNYNGLIYENNVNKSKNDVLSVLLETKYNSGEYMESTNVEFPTSGYVFNNKLSKCENGGELSYDVATKKIIMKSNASDKCFIYFNKEKEWESLVQTDYNVIKMHHSYSDADTMVDETIQGTGFIYQNNYWEPNVYYIAGYIENVMELKITMTTEYKLCHKVASSENIDESLSININGKLFYSNLNLLNACVDLGELPENTTIKITHYLDHYSSAPILDLGLKFQLQKIK